MDSGKNKFLIIGSIGSAIAALAHLGCIIFGGDWYRFFGAGEQMAKMAEDGHWYPTVVTSIIVLVYNADHYLDAFVDALDQQTIAYHEIIFVNNCSTGNSKNILTHLA